MNPRAGELGLLLVLLLMAGAVSWWLLLRPAIDSDPAALDELASDLDGWQAIEIEMDQDVAKMLNADHNVQRAYHHALGYTVFVYVGYYGASRGGVPEHTPDVCYPSQGWEIVESREQQVGGRDGLAVHEYVVENGGARRLVHFWYRTSQASGMTSVLGLRLRQFLGRLSNRGTDGALIRLSTAVRESEIETARQRLFSLDLRVEAELERVWPKEKRDELVSNRSSAIF